jgi:hypothetical protein
MQTIRGILFEPVGCLAEFPAEPFLEIAARLSGGKKKTSRSGSRAYWHLLNLMETSKSDSLEALEVAAVDGASLYEDVIPALSELKAMASSYASRRRFPTPRSRASWTRAACTNTFRRYGAEIMRRA